MKVMSMKKMSMKMTVIAARIGIGKRWCSRIHITYTRIHAHTHTHTRIYTLPHNDLKMTFIDADYVVGDDINEDSDDVDEDEDDEAEVVLTYTHTHRHAHTPHTYRHTLQTGNANWCCLRIQERV